MDLSSLEKVRSESLSEIFVSLIAELDNVKKEDVTSDFIEKQRQEKIYPTSRFAVSSAYGGYCPLNLIFPTRQEVDKVLQQEEKPIKCPW